MKTRAPLMLVLATVVAGCGSQTTTARRATTSVHRGEPYRLYTHCGIQWATIDGRFWRATEPLSDDNGNPPPGWGNPFQAGTLTFRSDATAEFSSRAGSVKFERTARTQPPVICS
jgi:hypothetical protein